MDENLSVQEMIQSLELKIRWMEHDDELSRRSVLDCLDEIVTILKKLSE